MILFKKLLVCLNVPNMPIPFTYVFTPSFLVESTYLLMLTRIRNILTKQARKGFQPLSAIFVIIFGGEFFVISLGLFLKFFGNFSGGFLGGFF